MEMAENGPERKTIFPVYPHESDSPRCILSRLETQYVQSHFRIQKGDMHPTKTVTNRRALKFSNANGRIGCSPQSLAGT